MATAKKAPAKKAAAKKVPAKKKATAKTSATAQTTRGREQDRKLIAAKQSYEVSYESRKTGKTAAEIKAAIEKKGHSRIKVEQH